MSNHPHSKLKSWKEWKQTLPNFLDASSSVSASTYGARRLPELKALYQACNRLSSAAAAPVANPFKSAGRATSKRHLRRRTTSYNAHKRHRFPTVIGETKKSTSTSRKARRKPSLLRHEHSSWQQQQQQDEDPGVAASSATSHWLTTHLWHAKRFHMAHNLFGWSVPLQHSNRGRHAAHRLLCDEHRTLLQDITWRMQPVVVSFTTDAKDMVVDCMRRMCPNFQVQKDFFGRGILHEPNAFPMKAIGPVEWWMREEFNELWLFVHPSIQSKVANALSSMFSTDAVSGLSVSRLNGGIACFQIRGLSSSKTICEALSVSLPRESSSTSSSPSSSSSSSAHLQIRVVEAGGKDSTSSTATPQDDRLIFDTANKDQTTLLLVRHDCEEDVKQGWNVFCPVAEAHRLFLALTYHANVVVIGCVEEWAVLCTRNAFPRDYPDCEQGQLYWDAADDSNDWLTFRAACECGTQRLKPKVNNVKACFESLASIVQNGEGPNGSSIIQDKKRSPVAVVVVRGSFGQPFVDLLHLCARVPASAAGDDGRKGRRRPRRPRGRAEAIRLACRLSSQGAAERIGRVEGFLASLSLAAAIQCQVQVRGRGTLRLGDEISGCSLATDGEIEADCRSPALGYVTAGGTFVAGAVQGIGFVGAARLLNFLASHQHPAMMHHNGQLHLVVQTSRKTKKGTECCCKGILALLL